MTTSCLVTGSAGFLGFHLARALAGREGHQVVCVDNFARGEDDEHGNPTWNVYASEPEPREGTAAGAGDGRGGADGRG